TQVFERIELALDRSDQALVHVKTSLLQAGNNLKRARADQRQLDQKPETNRAARQVLARTVQKNIAPDIGNASAKLHTVAEAAVVVNSVLGDLGNFPMLSATGLDTGRLEAMNKQLAEVGPAAWELSRLLGKRAQDADGDTDLSGIDETLKR